MSSALLPCSAAFSPEELLKPAEGRSELGRLARSAFRTVSERNLRKRSLAFSNSPPCFRASQIR